MYISETLAQELARRLAIPGGMSSWGVIIVVFYVLCPWALVTWTIGEQFGWLAGVVALIVSPYMLFAVYGYGVACGLRWQRLMNANGGDPSAW